MNGINKLSAAQALIESLLAENVDTIFGIISSHTMEIFDALYDHRDAIRIHMRDLSSSCTTEPKRGGMRNSTR